ncbi:MAG: hypothetical protein IJ262_02000 [Clostridia bacterium]|nr:hypothetical protein [Clostridia bacterium]MBQ8028161.1 hypothetical protein [Clostridia bacterium]
MDERKYLVVNVSGNTEKVLHSYIDRDEAISKMNIIGKRNRSGGIICVILGRELSNGSIARGREQIAVYDAWLERLLKD